MSNIISDKINDKRSDGMSDNIYRNSSLMRIVLCGLLLAILFSFTACGSETEKIYEQGMELYNKGHYDLANIQFAEAIRKEPGKAEYHITYGMSLLNMGEYETAQTEFIGVIRDSDKKADKKINKQAYRGIALSYFMIGNYEQAKAYFGLALESSVLSDMDNDIKAYQAECDMFMGNFDEAKKEFTDLIDNAKGTSDEEEAAYYLGRANIYYTLGEYAQAIDDYRQVIKLDKHCYEAMLGEYLAAKECGDDATAEDIMEDVSDIDKETAEGKYYQAVFNFHRGNYDAAEELLEQCSKEDFYEAEFYLGRICQVRGEYEAAKNHYKTYENKVPSGADAEYYNQLAGCYMELRDYNSAVQCLDKGYKLAGGTLKKQIMFNRVIACEKNDNYKKAKLYAEEYLELYEDADMVREYEFIKTRYRE